VRSTQAAYYQSLLTAESKAHISKTPKAAEKRLERKEFEDPSPYGGLKAASFPIRGARRTPGNQKYLLGDRPERRRREYHHRSGAQLNERRKLSRRRSPRKVEGRWHGSSTAQGLLTFSFLGAALVPPRAAAGLRAALPFIVSSGVCIRPGPSTRQRGTRGPGDTSNGDASSRGPRRVQRKRRGGLATTRWREEP
jgi:hypothetical protein